MEVYRSGRHALVFWFGGLGGITLAAPISVWLVVTGPLSARLVSLYWLVLIPMFWCYQLGWLATRIEITTTGECRFWAPRRLIATCGTEEITAVYRVGRPPTDWGRVNVRIAGRKRPLGAIGFPELDTIVERIRLANPNVETRRRFW